jgi:hypothetical protein
MSIALRVLPSKLELKRRDGSGTPAPWANVSFTTFVYASPVHTIPLCDQTGVPLHFTSSVISGSASRINARMRASVSPRHPSRSRIRWSMSREAASPVAWSLLLVPARTAPSLGEDLDLMANLRGLLAPPERATGALVRLRDDMGPPRQKLSHGGPEKGFAIGAGDGIRTRDQELGKLLLYQLSYARPDEAGILAHLGRFTGAVPAFARKAGGAALTPLVIRRDPRRAARRRVSRRGSNCPVVPARS